MCTCGKYIYVEYFPNRPTIARTNMPTEDHEDDEFKNFCHKPEFAMLKCFLSQIQATKGMAVLDVLSNHSPDEECFVLISVPNSIPKRRNYGSLAL